MSNNSAQAKYGCSWWIACLGEKSPRNLKPWKEFGYWFFDNTVLTAEVMVCDKK
jgi:hypothetical protein